MKSNVIDEGLGAAKITRLVAWRFIEIEEDCMMRPRDCRMRSIKVVLVQL